MDAFTYEYSAGGVIIQDRLVVMIRTHNQRGRTIWTFPKGRLERGESYDEAARREVREETGYDCKLRGPLGPTTYWYRRGGIRVKKVVQWFLFEPRRKVGSYNPEEVDEVAWVPIRSAYDRLTHRGDRKLLARVERLLDRNVCPS